MVLFHKGGDPMTMGPPGKCSPGPWVKMDLCIVSVLLHVNEKKEYIGLCRYLISASASCWISRKELFWYFTVKGMWLDALNDDNWVKIQWSGVLLSLPCMCGSFGQNAHIFLPLVMSVEKGSWWNSASSYLQSVTCSLQGDDVAHVLSNIIEGKLTTARICLCVHTTNL